MLRIGVLIMPSGRTGNDVDDLVLHATAAAQAGVSTVWSGQGFGYDALTALSAVAREVPGIELGATVPAPPRHPMVLAAQAQTVQAASGGRLVLGLAAGHPGLLKPYGIRFDRPATRMREYLAALEPILRRERAGSGAGDPSAAPESLDDMLTSTAVGGAVPAVPILLGAMGPVMVRIAGELADGTVTFLTGPRTLGDHIVPGVITAAEAAGRPSPRIVVSLPTLITSDVDRGRSQVNADWAALAAMPSYRSVLEREGAEDAGQIAAVGDERTVRVQLERLSALGVTDFYAALSGTFEEQLRTLKFLGGLTPPG